MTATFRASTLRAPTTCRFSPDPPTRACRFGTSCRWPRELSGTRTTPTRRRTSPAPAAAPSNASATCAVRRALLSRERSSTTTPERPPCSAPCCGPRLATTCRPVGHTRSGPLRDGARRQLAAAGAGGRRARRLLSQRHAPRLWTHRPVRNATRHAPRRHVGPPQRLDGRVHKSLGKRAPPVSHSSHRGYSSSTGHDVTERANPSTTPGQAQSKFAGSGSGIPDVGRLRRGPSTARARSSPIRMTSTPPGWRSRNDDRCARAHPP